MTAIPTDVRTELEKLEQKQAQFPDGRYFVPLANAYRKAGQLPRAIEVLRKGLARHPEYVSAHIVLGRCLSDAGDLPSATAEFRHVLQLDGQNLVALRTLGEFASNEGNVEDARKWFGHLLAVDPMNEEARRALEVINPTDVGGLPPRRPGYSASVAGSDTRTEKADLGEPDFLRSDGDEPDFAAAALEPADELSDVPTVGEGDRGFGGNAVVTETIADLYTRQGFYDRAVEVYRELIRRRGGDERLEGQLRKVRELAGLPEEEAAVPGAELEQVPFDDRGDASIAGAPADGEANLEPISAALDSSIGAPDGEATSGPDAGQEGADRGFGATEAGAAADAGLDSTYAAADSGSAATTDPDAAERQEAFSPGEPPALLGTDEPDARAADESAGSDFDEFAEFDAMFPPPDREEEQTAGSKPSGPASSSPAEEAATARERGGESDHEGPRGEGRSGPVEAVAVGAAGATDPFADSFSGGFPGEDVADRGTDTLAWATGSADTEAAPAADSPAIRDDGTIRGQLRAILGWSPGLAARDATPAHASWPAEQVEPTGGADRTADPESAVPDDAAGPAWDEAWLDGDAGDTGFAPGAEDPPFTRLPEPEEGGFVEEAPWAGPADAAATESSHREHADWSTPEPISEIAVNGVDSVETSDDIVTSDDVQAGRDAVRVGDSFGEGPTGTPPESSGESSPPGAEIDPDDLFPWELPWEGEEPRTSLPSPADESLPPAAEFSFETVLPEPAPEAAAAEEQGPMDDFDPSFPEPLDDGLDRPEAHAEEPRDDDDDDLESFQAWLRSLKR